MRSSLIYPNVLSPAPTPPPDKTRCKREGSDERYHGKNHRSSRSHYRRPRSRYSSSARARSKSPSPKKNVHFFDETPRPRSRRGHTDPEYPIVYYGDAPPIALNESAKDTARRLYRQAVEDGHLHATTSMERERPEFRRSKSSKAVMTNVAESGSELTSFAIDRNRHIYAEPNEYRHCYAYPNEYNGKYLPRWGDRVG